MQDPKSFYRERAESAQRYCRNVVFVLADESGKIDWNGMKITPYDFAATFVWPDTFGYRNPHQGELPGYKLDPGLSERVLNDSWKDRRDPAKRMESSASGIRFEDNLLIYVGYFTDEQTSAAGYLFYVSDEKIEHLSDAGIRFVHKGTRKTD